MNAGHGHHHPDHGADDVGGRGTTSRLVGAAGLNVGFAVVQVVVGLLLGSVVVLADAAHQVVDALGLLTALVAVLLARRPASSEMSYGWGKADALGGFVSGLLLLGSVAWITIEAVRRLFDPVEVAGGGVVAIGLVAIAVNGASILALSGHHHHHLSMRAARLHLLVDLAGSFVVVAAGLALVGTSWTWIDPVASLILSVAVLRATYQLLRSAGQELLDRVPSQVSIEAVTDTLASQPGVERVHHVHVRSLGQQRASVTAHVVVTGDVLLHDAQDHVDALHRALADKHGVEHATIQVECHPCADDGC